MNEVQRPREYFPATDVHLTPRKQIHREKSPRHRESDHRLIGKRLQVEQTHEARELAAAQQLRVAMQDALLGATEYTYHMEIDERVRAELDPIFNAISDWEKWQRGKRYLAPAEIAEQEAALAVGKK
ncbi:MAG: hypothetical protein H6773_00800 [Pseudomonadales bacterium]|nr:hypothetical protein [Pseudomonadales bacterium]